MNNLQNILRDIAQEPDIQDEIQLPKLFTKIEQPQEVIAPGDRVIWTAANSKNEIIAKHEAKVIRITKTGQVYIKTRPEEENEGYYRYVSKNRLRKKEE